MRVYVTDLWSQLPLDSFKHFADVQTWDLELDFVGSVVAIEDLKAGRIDAALLAIPNIEEVDLADYAVQAVAYTAARVHVHAENPIQELSRQDLQAIFDGNALQRIRHWGKFGVEAAFLGTVRPYIVTDTVSIVDDLFRDRVFPKGYFSKDIPIINQEEYEQKVIIESNSLCILPNAVQADQSKLLKISAEDGQPAFELNAQNLYYNDYPIAFSYYLVCQTDLIAEQLIPYFFSQQFVKLMTSVGYFALPEFAWQ